MSKHRCTDWSERNVSAGQRRAADRAANRHARKYPVCASADVCVHTGLIFDSAFCCGCGRQIG